MLRLADSGLPVGGFAHSGGVEALARQGLVTGPDDLTATLLAYRTLALDRFDGWLARTAHRAVEARDRELLVTISSEEIAARPALTQRSACLRMGRAVLELGGTMAVDEESGVHEWVVGVLGDRSPWATAFGAVSAAIGIDEEGAASAAVYSALSAQVGAAVRLGLLGADASQGVLARVLEGPSAGHRERWSSFAPLIDLAQMEHEHLGDRLFAS